MVASNREKAKAFTVGELARLAGLDPKRILGLLEANEVPTYPYGRGERRRHLLVWKADLERAFPDILARLEAEDG